MLRLLALIALAPFLVDPAVAQLTFEPSGPPEAVEPPGTRYLAPGVAETEGLAGETGESLTRMNGRQHEFLYALEFGEAGDDPCYLRAFWADASQGRNRIRTRTTTFSDCNGQPWSTRYIGAPTSQVEGTHETPRAIFELRVMTNGRNGDHLKLKAAHVGHRQILLGFPDSDGFRLPNAKTRTQETSRCSQGYVNGLEIHHDRIHSLETNLSRVTRESITGITLRCKSFHRDR